MQLAAILDKGSITAAAQHLGVAQPTLTRNMKTLEMQAGAELFGRSRFGVRGTPLGEQLAREGRSIARGLEKVREVTSRHRFGLQHQIRIGAGPVVGAVLLPALTRRLLDTLPGVALTIRIERPAQLVEQLSDGEHDLVIAPWWTPRPPLGIERVELARDRMGLFCGRDHPLARRRRVPPAEFSGHDWISLGTASPFEEGVHRMLSDAGIDGIRTQVATVGDAYVLLRTLEQGRHLAVLPRLLIERLAHTFDLHELALPVQPVRRDLYLWWRESAAADAPEFALMCQRIAQHARELLAG